MTRPKLSGGSDLFGSIMINVDRMYGGNDYIWKANSLVQPA